MSRRQLPHTADTGVEAEAPNLPRLIVELALAMFESMGETVAEPVEEVTVVVESETIEDLIVDVLSEWLFIAETRELHFTSFDVESLDGSNIRMHGSAVPLSLVEMTGPSIKAVTYHGLVVGEEGGQWHGRVYFDV